MSVVLRLEHVSRSFPGVRALSDVSLDVSAGEVHALVGENGAGKSTLINLISGVLQPETGRILLDGHPVHLTDPVSARRQGIVAVHQEADLFGNLSVAENMALATGLPKGKWGFVDWPKVHANARAAIEPLRHPIDVRQSADSLSVAERHLTQVAAAVAEQPKIVILDEPTSVLSLSETDWLFDHVDRLRRAGVGIIYISHRQEEIFRLADRISVLRDGELIWTGNKTEIDPARLVSHMVGRTMDLPTRHARPDRPSRPARLSVHHLTDARGAFADVSFEIAAGEVLGLYGLVGSGRTELAQAIFGRRALTTGDIRVDGQPVTLRRSTDAVRAGIAYVPEDRLRQAVCGGLAIRDNALLALVGVAHQPILASRRRDNRLAGPACEQFRVKRRSLDDPIEQLSGGNQQKVILARWMLTQPKVLLLDEPTRGVDVAAKADIHRIIRELDDAGAAVLLISSELPEILAHCDRVGVFREGRLVDVIDGDRATAIDIAKAALPATSARNLLASARPAGVSSAGPTRVGGLSQWITQGGLALAIVLLALLLAATTDGRFTRPANLANLANNIAPRAILALASAVVIMAGGIDISIGSLIALSAASGGLTMKALAPSGLAVPVGIAVSIAVAAIGSAINGGITVLGRIHPIVVTLGAMTVYGGLVKIITDEGVVGGLPATFATGPILGIDVSVWLLLATLVGAVGLMGYTPLGRKILAIGSSPRASKLVGISRGRTWVSAFAVAGVLVGLAAMLELAQNRTMQPTMGKGYELRAITAAVIGGVAIEGGRGSVVGVLLGALLLVLIENGLVLWSVPGTRYDLVIGSLLLLAVAIGRWNRRSPS